MTSVEKIMCDWTGSLLKSKVRFASYQRQPSLELHLGKVVRQLFIFARTHDLLASHCHGQHAFPGLSPESSINHLPNFLFRLPCGMGVSILLSVWQWAPISSALVRPSPYSCFWMHKGWSGRKALLSLAVQRGPPSSLSEGALKLCFQCRLPLGEINPF